MSTVAVVAAAIAAFTLSVTLSGCAALSGDTTRTTSYSSSAKDNYDHGLVELKSENWLDAIKFFQFTRAKFGFSKWATLAELGIADAELGRERYAEAVDAFKGFIKNHPTHEKVQNGYAAFQIGNAFFKQIPTEWFLVPPAFEKDQGPVRDALRELSVFVQEYADSQYATDARRMIVDCTRRLADHELYVANFYLGRDKPRAAIGRLDGLLNDFPHSTVEPEVLLLMARTQLKMDDPGAARRTLERLIATYPTDYHADQARLYLQHIAEKYSDQKPDTTPAAGPKPGA